MRSVTQRAQNDNDDLIAAVTTALERAVAAQCPATFAERERAALEVSNEAARRLLEGQLQRLADGELGEIHHGLHCYKPHQAGDVKYHSLCGPLHVRRWTYRATGMRNGPTIVPLELRAGLIENATPALAYAIAQGYAKQPIRSVQQDLHAACRRPPSYATLGRMAKAIGSDAKKALMEIERRVRAEETLPAKATGITIGLDRTTIPMEETEIVPSTGGEKVARERVVVRYRMAYAGTVALTDAKGEVLRSWCYAVPAHEGPLRVVRRMMNDVRRALEDNPKRVIGVVQDGADEMWNVVRDGLREAKIEKWHEAIDMFHLFERVAKALEVVERDEHKRHALLRRWKRRILESDRTITEIANFFDIDGPWKWWKSRGQYVPRWSEKQAREIDRIIGCYIGYRKHFRYVEMVQRGLHVGSGVTEGACKSLITIRAKRSGQRWRPDGISAVLTLRSLVESDRFDAFWQRFATRYAPLARAA